MNSKSLIDIQALKAEALRLGFSAVGCSVAGPVDESVCQAYAAWLRDGHQAEMHYLENHLEKRFNPTLLVEGARTVVSLLMNYHPGQLPTQPALAWYAQGRDYHDVLHELTNELMNTFQLHGRSFTDSAPVLDRYWAWRAGLGFIGRHGQLVVPRQGSAFFIAELIIQEEASQYDSPLTDSYFSNLCGRCQRCVDACPTQALQLAGPMRAERCLSYLSIEQRGPIPDEAKPFLKDCFYGCDRCLRACPHLHAPAAAPLDAFQASEELLRMQASDWRAMDEEKFRTLFHRSAVKRAKYAGLRRNIAASEESSEE